MARITVEDCVNKVSNRFKLVLLSAQRARSISAGSPLEVERDNDKNTVIALREIAEEKLAVNTLEEGLIRRLRRVVPAEDNIENEDIPKIEEPTPEMDEEALLKALQTDQNTKLDGRSS